MAEGTITREGRGGMVGICGAVVFFGMARVAIRWGPGKHASDVATVALYRRVRPGQRELCSVVVEGSGGPRGGCVADGAVGWEPGLCVIGIRRGVEGRQMAARAIRRRPREFPSYVALRAAHAGVRPGQRKRGQRIVIECRA